MEVGRRGEQSENDQGVIGDDMAAAGELVPLSAEGMPVVMY